jgi:hypothetical protein
VVDKNGTHNSCPVRCSNKLYGFQGIKKVNFMLSVDNNRVGVPELCYANIYEIAWSGCHIDIKATKNNSTLGIISIIGTEKLKIFLGLHNVLYLRITVDWCSSYVEQLSMLSTSASEWQKSIFRTTVLRLWNAARFFFLVSKVRCREWFNCTIMHCQLKIAEKQTYYYSASKTLQRKFTTV